MSQMLLSGIWLRSLAVSLFNDHLCRIVLSLLFPNSSSFAFHLILAPITTIDLIHVVIVIIIQASGMH